MMKASLLLLAAALLCAQAAPGAAPATPQCTSCLWAVRAASDALCDQAAQGFLLQAAEQGCEAVLGQTKADCAQLSEALVPVAIEYVRENMDGAQLCSAADVCPAQQLQAAAPAHAAAGLFKRHHAVRNDAACGLCEHVMDAVRAEAQDLIDPLTVQQLKEKGLKACTQLPSPGLVDACSALVADYATILAQLPGSIDSHATCAAAGLCAPQLLARARLPALSAPLLRALAGARSRVAAVKSAGDDSGMCEVCHLAVTEAHDMISDPQFQSELIGYSKSLCDNVGAQAADTCKMYIDMYAPVVFGMAMGYLQPEPLCQTITLCPASPSPAPPPTAGGKKTLLPGATWAMAGVAKGQPAPQQPQQPQPLPQQPMMGLTRTQAADDSANVPEHQQQQKEQKEQQEQAAELAAVAAARGAAQERAQGFLQQLSQRLEAATAARLQRQREQQQHIQKAVF